MVFDWNNPDNDLIVYEESKYDRFGGGFSGKYFAFRSFFRNRYSLHLVEQKKCSISELRD